MKTPIIINCQTEGVFGEKSGYKDLFTPLGGRFLIERVIDRLANDGYDKIYIRSQYHAKDIVKRLDSGTPWGLKVKVLNKNVDSSKMDSINPNWKNSRQVLNDLKTLLCDGGRLYDMLPSWPLKPGIWINRGVKIHPDCKLIAPVYIGENVEIAEKCTIGPFTSIEKNCYISDSVEIQHSLILPQTFCSPQLSINKMIVDEGTILDTKRNLILDVDADIVHPINREHIA